MGDLLFARHVLADDLVHAVEAGQLVVGEHGEDHGQADDEREDEARREAEAAGLLSELRLVFEVPDAEAGGAGPAAVGHERFFDGKAVAAAEAAALGLGCGGGLDPVGRNQVLQLDALLADDAVPAALKLMMSALQPGPGLGEALDLVGQRKKKLGLPNRKPSPPPDPEGLVAQLLALRPAPVAIEATWDGESVGFLVELEAILPAPSREHPRYTARHLHTFRDAVGDWRVFVGAVPPWPEAGEAAELGTALANRLNIPFHFASPDRPDLDAPRWWHKRR